MTEPFKIFGAVFVFLQCEGKIFLMRRANTGYRDGYYALPSGHIEHNESVLNAAVREVKEETGLSIQPEQLKFAHALYRRSDRTYADYYFTCDSWEGEPIIAEPHKCDAADWFSVDELPEKVPSEVIQALECLKQGKPFSEIITPGREGK